MVSIKPITNIIKNEISVIKNSKRAGEIAKHLYPDKKCVKTIVMTRKMVKEVGPEPVAGLLIGTFSNPMPGFGIVGYSLGRIFSRGRKCITNLVKTGKLNIKV